MFVTPNTHAVLRNLQVRAKDEREKDSNHIVELKFEVPLDHALAEEIQPAMARDLFDKAKDGYVPKPELSDAAFDLSPGMQIFTARLAEELPEVARIAGVQIRKIKVRKDGGAWFLSFLVNWTISDPMQTAPFLVLISKPVLLTFQLQNPQLDMDAADEPEAEAPKRGRRGPRRGPRAALPPAPPAEDGDDEAETGEDLTL